MAFTVRVIGIFTRNARSSSTAEQRRARLLADLAAANQAWGSGFVPGVRCGLQFVSGGTYNAANTTIAGSTVTLGVNDPRIVSLIEQVRRQENQRTAIYLVYLSGSTFAGGSVIGSGGPRFTFFNSTSSYGLVGHVAMTDIAGNALNRYTFAHEAGHVLFGRFLNSNPGSFTISDPSNPGSNHNNNPQNLMFPAAPSRNPFITSAQCITARRSKVIVENAAAGSLTRKSSSSMVRKLNNAVQKKIRKAAGPGNRIRRKPAASPIPAPAYRKRAVSRNRPCCMPVRRRAGIRSVLKDS